MNTQDRLVDKAIYELTINSTGRAGFRTFRLLILMSSSKAPYGQKAAPNY